MSALTVTASSTPCGPKTSGRSTPSASASLAAALSIKGPRPPGRLFVMGEQTVAVVSRPVRRFVIHTGRPYEQFRKQWERSVPAWSWGTAVSEAKGGGGWPAVENLAERMAGKGLLNLSSFDPSSVMRLAGHNLRAVTYLADNLVIEERLFQHDPAAIGYLPLRLTISERPGEEDCTLTFDKPTDLFDGCDDAKLSEAAHEVEQA